MKTLSKWLMATAFTVISFFVIMMLLSGILEPSSVGIDLSSTVILEIAASRERVDRAVEDIRQRCPGIRSRY